MAAPDHDRLFKELLTTFFVEFLELFFPDAAEALDKEFGVMSLDKEVFTDIASKEKHEVDILMQARFRGEDAFFLIHVENQSKAQSDFPPRMFKYFARLTEKYRLPVYPIVVFSYDAPLRPEPSEYRVQFAGWTPLRFQYRVVQLNRLPWRRFVRQENPVASALMAKMKMRPEDRPRVKLECLRLLVKLKLDPARTRLIGGFVESYLRLSAQEMKTYEREFAALEPEERRETVEVLTYWEERGLERGRQEGRQEGQRASVLRQLRRRFGDGLPASAPARLEALTPEQLDDLAEALLDFQTVADWDAWLARTQAA